MTRLLAIAVCVIGCSGCEVPAEKADVGDYPKTVTIRDAETGKCVRMWSGSRVMQFKVVSEVYCGGMR